MKKKLLLISLVVICAALFVTGSLAYFTAEDTAHNVITTGNVDIQVVETMVNEDGDEVEFPGEGIDGVMPGTSVSKIVRLENIGKSDAWVRIKVDLAAKSADGSELDKGIVTPDYDTETWTYGGGYYYYNEILKPGDLTTALFENVTFDKDMGNEYKSGEISVIINAYAVQSDNNPIPEGSDVTGVKGWPES